MAKTGGAERAAPTARFAAIARDYAADRRVTAGRLFASDGLKVDGRIFAMLVKDRLVVKLPCERVDRLIAAGQAERFDPGHGRLMKEWASITAADADWSALAREARAFVAAAGKR
jgi:TfoX/Sxy family transcriptional regulator of competence genes